MPLAVAEFQFYVPFALPRSSDWEQQRVTFSFVAEDATVAVVPMGVGDDLFVGEAGATLADEIIERELQPPNPKIRLPVRDLTVDRMMVEVRKQLTSLDELRRDEVRNALYVLAIRAANSFLAHARVAAGSPDAMHIDVQFDPASKGTVILTPMTVTWWDESGNPIPVHGTSASGAPNAAEGSVYTRRVSRGAASFHTIGRAVVDRGEFPDIVELLLLDASWYVIAYRISEALLMMGTAAEIAAERYVDRSGRASDPAVKAAVKASNVSFAERNFDLVPFVVHNRRLSDEQPDLFELVKRMYRARNKVAHEGHPYEDTPTGKVAVRPPVAKAFAEATRTAIAWLDGL